MRIVKLKDQKELQIRKAAENDAEDMIQYLNLVGGESDNLLFGENEFRLSIEEEKAYINRTNEDFTSLMLLGLVDNQIAAIGQITALKNSRLAHNSEIAISVRKDYWRQGIGMSMMEELLQFAKDSPKIKNVNLAVRASNEAAIRLYKQIGFEQVGCNKNFFYIKGEFDDRIIMELYL